MNLRIARWWKSHPFTIDAVFAVVLFVLAASDVAMWTRGTSPETQPNAITYVLLAGQTLPLAYRRRYPVAVMYLVSASIGLYWIIDYPLGFDAAAMIGIYSAAKYGVDRHRTWINLGAVAVTITTLGTIDFSVGDDEDPWYIALGFAGLHVAAALLGELFYQRRQRIVDLQDRAARAEEALEASARLAVVSERARIAREMHDVVAHGMSIISVQASAAQEIAHVDADKTVEILENIENVSRESLSEMRRMLGVLRGGEAAEISLSPQPTLAAVDAAVDQSVDAGVAVDLVVTGEQRDLPPGVELAAFRIVQEALTNVRKHAGRSASASVRIAYGSGAVTVEIIDDGAGAATSMSPTGGGNGLIGIRERVEIYSGEFDAGPRSGGG
ncbi:MAG: sensor histidine kinase, partial [Actinobacteria bacterium]